MNPASKMEYRRIRGAWGKGLALAWLVYRWLALTAHRKAVLAGLGNCGGFLNGVRCTISHSNADGAFAAGMFLAVLCAPVAWIVGHYIARWQVDRADRAGTRAQEHQHAERLAKQQSESTARLAQVEQDAHRAHGQADRSEFLHKLGAVSDFLGLLGHETDPSRIANIRLGVAQALRDLTAKHTIDRLAQMVGSDDAVTMTLSATLRRLEAASFQDAPEFHILSTALRKNAERKEAVDMPAEANLISFTGGHLPTVTA